MTHPNILGYEQRKAKERQAATQAKPGERVGDRSVPVGTDLPDSGRTRDQLAAKAGVGAQTIQRAIKVRKQGTPGGGDIELESTRWGTPRSQPREELTGHFS